MNDLLKDPMFFYTIAFVIFLGLVYKYGRAGILSWIDGEIQKVRDQLEDAKKLRAEAQETLAKYKEEQARALADAATMIQNAKDEAARLKAQAEADLRVSLQRQEQQAAERIRMAEEAAMKEIRERAIDLAMEQARAKLTNQLQGDAATKLIDQAIADLPATSSKAKAA